MSLKGFLLDKGTNEYSATRLAFLVWVFGVFVVWVVASVQSWSLQAVPESVLTLIGVLTGGKAIQRFGEKKP